MTTGKSRSTSRRAVDPAPFILRKKAVWKKLGMGEEGST